jgi:hypothetical protein
VAWKKFPCGFNAAVRDVDDQGGAVQAPDTSCRLCITLTLAGMTTHFYAFSSENTHAVSP